MLKIDIDNFPELSRLTLQIIMYAMPRPFYVRISSSGTGLHIRVDHRKEWDWSRFAYDDPMRIDLDEQRERLKLPVHNLLWDVKNGKRAGHWHLITSERNIESFLDAIETQFIYSKHYNEVLYVKDSSIGF